jgi:hypothetical protein
MHTDNWTQNYMSIGLLDVLNVLTWGEGWASPQEGVNDSARLILIR